MEGRNGNVEPEQQVGCTHHWVIGEPARHIWRAVTRKSRWQARPKPAVEECKMPYLHYEPRNLLTGKPGGKPICGATTGMGALWKQAGGNQYPIWDHVNCPDCLKLKDMDESTAAIVFASQPEPEGDVHFDHR